MHCIKFNNELLSYCAGYIIIIVRDCGITSTLTGKTIHFIDHKPDIVTMQLPPYKRMVTDESAKTKSFRPTEA
jgi:hypothetical protein